MADQFRLDPDLDDGQPNLIFASGQGSPEAARDPSGGAAVVAASNADANSGELVDGAPYQEDAR